MPANPTTERRCPQASRIGAPMTKAAAPTSTTTSVSLMRDRTFARLWFTQAATQVGGNMALYALTVLVFTSTRSNTAVSALVMSFVLPTIFLSAVAGVVVDRLDLRLALVGPNLARAGMTFGLALAGANVAVLLALNLGISFTSIFLTPAEGSHDPARRPTRAAGDGDGRVQPDTPGFVRRRIRLPRAVTRDGGGALVRPGGW